MKIKNIILALKDQLPLRRLIKNILNGKIYGLFHKRSHFRANGQAKVTYNTKETATKSAEAMSKKTGFYFSNYKCVWCDGFHIGKNNVQFIDGKKVYTSGEVYKSS